MGDATADQVKSAADAPGAVFLDVRNGAEVKEARLSSRPFLNVSCTLDDCSELMARADELLPDKNGMCVRSAFAEDVWRLSNCAPPHSIPVIFTSMYVSTRDRFLQIRSSCGQSEGVLGAVGLYQGTECRWFGRSAK
jgi:hypothetical protein